MLAPTEPMRKAAAAKLAKRESSEIRIHMDGENKTKEATNSRNESQKEFKTLEKVTEKDKE